MKKIKLFGGVCLTVVLLVTLCAVPAFADEENESGPLPPSIMPVLVLSGSDYDMGYQYYQQLFDLFGPWILEPLQREFTGEEILALKAYQWYIKDYAPEMIDMFKGMAKGATDAGVELSYAEVLAKYTGTRSYPGTEPPGSEYDDLPPWCSAWAAWGSTTTDGSLIGGNSNDGQFLYNTVVMVFPDNGNNYVTEAYAGDLCGSPKLNNKPAMNNKGVFIGTTGGYTRRDIDKAYGYDIPCAGAMDHLMRVCDTAAEAYAMSSEWKRGVARNSLLADVRGDAFVVEYSAAFQEVRKPGEWGTGEEEYGEDTDFIYCANNYFTPEGGEAILAEKWIEHAGWLGRSASISAIPRNKQMWTMFDRYHGEVDLDFAKMMWRMPGEPPPGSPIEWTQSYGPGHPYWETQGEGWDQKIGNLNNEWIGIMLPDDGDEGIAYFCNGPAARVAYPLCPNCTWYQIDNPHTFYELTLASDPAAVVKAAKSAALGYIAEAYNELMWLEETDPVYLAWNEVYSTANAEYYEGKNWTTKAESASGNKQLLYYSKAATAFTRSQAHAKQVYNALVPPATCPKDLGLQPYKEPKWEVTEVAE